MSYLLDTCILSKLRKIKIEPNPLLTAWISMHSESAFFINVLSIGEIQKGISKLTNHQSKHKIVLETWLNRELIPRFEDRIIPIDIQTVTIWGTLCGENQKKGIVLPTIDALLAASALQNQLILVTENTKNFIHTGARLLNPLMPKHAKTI